MTTLTDSARKRALCARLARVEGQLRGLQKLVESGADMEQVAQQMAAARKALDKSFFALVGGLIEEQARPDKVADLLVRFA